MPFEDVVRQQLYRGKPFVCAIDGRAAARYEIFGLSLDLCPGCIWYLLNRGWDIVAQREADSGLAREPAGPYPYPETPRRT
jgi:hypothetical protein